MNTLTDNLDSLVAPPLKTSDIEFTPNDTGYRSFLGEYNGGYFYQRALHFYGFDKTTNYHDILPINASIQKLYSNFSFANGFFSFGCDALYNQYGFYNGSIVMLDIYSGEAEEISGSFNDFIVKLENESNYYTAKPLLAEYELRNGKLANGERLAAVIPFPLGGEFDIANLYTLPQDKLLEFAASIANQLKDLSDGSNVILSSK